MATTYKSLDEFKAAFGHDRDTKTESADDKKAGKKQKKDKAGNSSKKTKKKKKYKSGTMASVAAERRAAQAAATKIKKPEKLDYAIQCPKHNRILDTGHTASISVHLKGEERVQLFYCPQCRQYYFTTKKAEYGASVAYNGTRAKNIQASIYQWVDERWKCILLNEPQKPSEDKGKGKGERSVIGKHTDEQQKELLRQKALTEMRRAEKVQNKFNPKTDTLYIHKGLIKCITEKHDVISVTLKVPTDEVDRTGIINANYCFDCDRFFLSLNEYEAYRKRSQIMIVKFQFLDGATYDAISMQWAEQSPLMLAGYSVAANRGYSDAKRRRILSAIIDAGVVSKPDVIRYIGWFIKRNEKNPALDDAREKWIRDLEFIRGYRLNEQKSKEIKKIEQYRR